MILLTIIQYRMFGLCAYQLSMHYTIITHIILILYLSRAYPDRQRRERACNCAYIYTYCVTVKVQTLEMDILKIVCEDLELYDVYTRQFIVSSWLHEHA